MGSSKNRKILVTGASGKLGRRVTELLVEAGGGAVIAVTRTPDAVRDLSVHGIEVRKADFDQPADELAKAFEGADRMLLISTDAVDRPGHRFEQHKRAIDGAVRAGVQHVVYTSLFGVKSGSPVLIAKDHLDTEQALEASGLGFTALRNNLYTDSLLMSLRPAMESGKLFAAAGDGGAAYVTREDCGRAAAAALLDNFEGKRRLAITGPAVVAYSELAVLAGELSGRNVDYIPVDEDRLVAELTKQGMPGPVSLLLASFDSGMKMGLFGPATDEIRTLTGHDPRSVEGFLQPHGSTFSAIRKNL